MNFQSGARFRKGWFWRKGDLSAWQFLCESQYSLLLKRLYCVPVYFIWASGAAGGTPKDSIEELVIQELKKLKVTMSVVKGIASIDVKKDEEGLLTFAEENAFPIRFYSAEELNAVEGDFTPSAFVAKTVGVDNVCERAAVLDSDGGKLLLRKTSRNGVTLAIAAEELWWILMNKNL